MDTFLETKGTTFSYGRELVLKGVNVKLRFGEVLGILGPNGAGKSTLINIMSGALTPSAGQVLMHDSPLRGYAHRERAKSIALVPQESHIPFPFTSLEIVLMGRAPHLPRFGFESRRDIDIALEAMGALDCRDLAGRDIRSLSGGERRRVIIARALAQNPRALLLDEPTSFLDIRHTSELARLMRGLAKRCGIAVGCVMHDINLAATSCDNIVFLKDGRIAAEGTPDEVITPETIGKVFGTSVTVGRDPKTGAPYCLPVQ
jgi:iron complex transport system ATP-binding protein